MKYVVKSSDDHVWNLSVRKIDNSNADERDVYTLNSTGEEEKELVRFYIDEDEQPVVKSFSPSLNITQEKLLQELDALPSLIAEAKANGDDFSSEVASESKIAIPYDPNDIRVEPKNFSLRQIIDMIEDKDLDLSPDFQRNFVWDAKRKSRLIESILLRIPIPVFYFSMDEMGVMHVVDGVQRLTTISQFMAGKFPLQDLEYLKSLNGLRFTPKKQERVDSNVFLDDTYSRRINATQISVNVIDSGSPGSVIYDVFRRINTGGRPLNDQEMRNCLMSKNLRHTLNEMSKSKAFMEATGKGIGTVRMQAQEMCLRFLSFKQLYDKDGNFDNYSGQMDSWLDEAAGKFSQQSLSSLDSLRGCFDRAMRNAFYLFGRHAFRRVRENTKPESGRYQINKALFICWSVVLASIPEEKIRNNFQEGVMVAGLGKAIESDAYFNSYLSNGTNGWKNMKYILEKVESLLSNI